MKLFDSHCHLDDRMFDEDIDSVAERMNAAGVAAAMLVGIDRGRSQKAVQMADSRVGFYASVGVHPHDAKNCSRATLQFLRSLAKNRKVRAWGETGLDFNRMFSPREDQEKCFLRQLDIADELRLPLIFHERDSGGRFLEMLESRYQKRTGVVHCFSGNKSELEAYLKLGLHIGITGILTIHSRGADLRKLVPLIPRERILIETDAPFLTPAPEKNRIRRNEPAFVKSVMLKLAEVRNEDPGLLADVIWKNTCNLYGIPC